MVHHINTSEKNPFLVLSKESAEIQFDILVKEAHDYAIFVIDTDGIILSWNTGAERIKQYKAEEVVGLDYAILYRDEDRKAGRPMHNIIKTLTTGRFEEQWWRKKKDGSVFWADVVMTAIYSESGQLIGLSKIVHDISVKKNLEDELASAKKSAEEARSLKSIFVANMSHEIRTPLASILGFAGVLKDNDCSQAEKITAVNSIDRNGKNLLRLIDDLLDISMSTAGNFDIEISQVSVRKIVSDVIAYFKTQASDKGLILKSKIHNDVPEQISSDPHRLRQILDNIVGNAVKFTDRGEICIEVRYPETVHGRRKIEFTIKDTGPGLTEKERENLFTLFSQVDSTFTRKFGGTGIGLVLSRKLAQQLGGDIVLDKIETSFGSSFKITIADMDDAYLNKNNVQHKKKYPVTTSGKKVLVVDDSPDNQVLLSLLLKKWGVKNEVAVNGAEAVEKAMKTDYNLILMDIQMPVMDGNEAMRTLRKSGYKGPIVAVTAHTMNEEKAKAFDSGCDDYLVKPIDKNHLSKILETYISPDNSMLNVSN